jgi:large subunit ribosomal protein L28
MTGARSRRGGATSSSRLPGEHRYVRMRLPAKAISTVDKLGIEVAVARMRARGERI